MPKATSSDPLNRAACATTNFIAMSDLGGYSGVAQDAVPNDDGVAVREIGKSIRRRSLKDGPARRNPVLEPAPNRAHAHYVNFTPLRTPEGGDRSGRSEER